jgi:DNA polymerase-3 subunit gamma/tau
MLSQSAFNALLKTLEEPPLHVKFIFATTEAYKISQTILSRCQRFEFKPISEATIAEKLGQIAEREQIQVEPLALRAIGRLAEGGMRDAQSIFEQIVSFGNNHVTAADVIGAYGLVSEQEISAIIACVTNGDYAGVIQWAERLKGYNLTGILSDIEKRLHSDLSTIENALEIAKTLEFLDIINTSRDALRNSGTPEILFQLALFRAIEARRRHSIDEVIALLRETRNNSGTDRGKKIDTKAPAIASAEGGQRPASLSRPTIGKMSEERVETFSKKAPEDTGNADQLSAEVREKLSHLFSIEA